MIPAWVKWICVLLIVALIYGYGHQQFAAGERSENSRWVERENKALSNANARIKGLEDKYRAQEQSHAEQLASISSKYQEDLKNVKTEKDRVIAGIRSGTFRLHIPVAAVCKSGGSGTAETASAAIGRDAEARGELSSAAAEFLVGLSAECDEIARQLWRAQQVIIEDRAQ